MSNLKSLTKAELVALLQDRNAEIMGMRQALGDMKHDLARVAPKTPHRIITIYGDGRPSRSLPAHFAAARAEAMASGKCVSVAIN